MLLTFLNPFSLCMWLSHSEIILMLPSFLWAVCIPFHLLSLFTFIKPLMFCFLPQLFLFPKATWERHCLKLKRRRGWRRVWVEGEGQPSKGHLLVIFMPSSLFSSESKPSVAISTTRLDSVELWGALALTYDYRANQNCTRKHPLQHVNAQLSQTPLQLCSAKLQ